MEGLNEIKKILCDDFDAIVRNKRLTDISNIEWGYISALKCILLSIEEIQNRTADTHAD